MLIELNKFYFASMSIQEWLPSRMKCPYTLDCMCFAKEDSKKNRNIRNLYLLVRKLNTINTLSINYVIFSDYYYIIIIK